MMRGRKGIGRVAIFLIVALVIGSCFAIHNLSTLLLITKPSEISVHHGSGRQVEPLVKITEDPNPKRAGSPRPNPKFHVAVTATDSTYSKWQCRIMYYWYNRVKDLPGSDMGGFTRVLHSGQPDNLMGEIPTFVVDPLPPGVDQVCIFVR